MKGAAADELFAALAARADPDFAVGMQRYFPHGIRALGVSNAAVVEIANDYFRDRRDVPAVHLEQIPQTQRWVESSSPWARRAANVAVVKFVRRKVGRSAFELPLSHVFDNCTRLMHDDDAYVQKGCGWLLKVTAEVHPDEVAGFLRTWHTEMTRDTFRYAIEKLDRQTRLSLMALGEDATR